MEVCGAEGGLIDDILYLQNTRRTTGSLTVRDAKMAFCSSTAAWHFERPLGALEGFALARVALARVALGARLAGGRRNGGLGRLHSRLRAAARRVIVASSWAQDVCGPPTEYRSENRVRTE